jgi:protein MpaA
MVPAVSDKRAARAGRRADTSCGSAVRLCRDLVITFRLIALLGIGWGGVIGCGAPVTTAGLITAAPFGALNFSDDSPCQVNAPAPVSATRVELGRSVNGVPLTLEILGEGPDGVLIVGGMHGDEPTGAKVAGELARFLRAHPERLVGRTVGILARVNPDGLSRGTRANARGVDLNRNFPSRRWRRARAGELSHGPAAASEPETLAIMRAIERIKPKRIIDIHSIGCGQYCNNYDGAAQHLAEILSLFNGYPARADIGYPTPGALGCWAGNELGIPTITLELPRELSHPACWRENADALLAFIDAGHERSDRSTALAAGSR